MKILTKLVSVLIWLSPAFDKLRGPVMFEFLWRRLNKTQTLSQEQIDSACSVLGPPPIAYPKVRISQAGRLNIIFRRNRQRAFTTFHTLNLPEETSLATVVHELTHVCQFEQVGTKYMWQALKAQLELGTEAYHYGGPDGLVTDQGANKRFSDYNREQQAQIAQDYFEYVIQDKEQLTPNQRTAYDFFINQLRAREL
jgi:hypothetical protein